MNDMEKKFEFVDITTADVAFVAYGRDLNELFANAALAMFNVIIDTRNVESKIEREIKVEGDDLVSLLFNWLNELLFYVDAENLAFSEFDVVVDREKFTLTAKCRGEEIDLEKHDVKTHVKAATMHKMTVERKDGYWEARVILDI
jgi:SHS2 domain-containing protein